MAIAVTRYMSTAILSVTNNVAQLLPLVHNGLPVCEHVSVLLLQTMVTTVNLAFVLTVSMPWKAKKGIHRVASEAIDAFQNVHV